MTCTLNDLRAANIRRIPEFKNAKGEPAHALPDGSDWSPADWLLAVIGEVGEAANLLKKVRRGDRTLDDARSEIGHELADVIIYLDILAYQLRVSIEAALPRVPMDRYYEDRTPAQWFLVIGEHVGNLCRSVEYVRAVPDDRVGVVSNAIYAIAYVVFAIIRVAEQLDIEIMSAVQEKFNLVSERVGSAVRL